MPMSFFGYYTLALLGVQGLLITVNKLEIFGEAA
jgi:hypothetical protein